MDKRYGKYRLASPIFYDTPYGGDVSTPDVLTLVWRYRLPRAIHLKCLTAE